MHNTTTRTATTATTTQQQKVGATTSQKGTKLARIIKLAVKVFQGDARIKT